MPVYLYHLLTLRASTIDNKLSQRPPLPRPLLRLSLTMSVQDSLKGSELITESEAPSKAHTRSKKGFRFWMIFLSICIALFLSALELTAVSTALPVIVNELQGDEFVWVGAAYSLASTAFLPMSGGVSEVRLITEILVFSSRFSPRGQIFGRRVAMLFALVCFILGSGLCGAAKSMNWLIAARSKSNIHWFAA